MTDPRGAAGSVFPASVRDAFGLTGPARQLPGGEGRSVRIGATVLKPTEDGPEARWTAEQLANVDADGFRLARPLPARDGRWVVDGWSAADFVEGEPGASGRWAELLAAGRAFHAALAPWPRPTFLETRTHPWALADRVAWGEATLTVPPPVVLLHSRLESARSPVTADCQLVHGDLSGNVLFAEGQPPAIIDFSPYWRPAAYADAIIAVDGLLWYGAGRDLVPLAWSSPDFPQLLVRALIFRLIAGGLRGLGTGVAAQAELAAFEAAIAEVEALLR